MITVEVAGTKDTVDFPDDTSPEVIQSAMQQRFGKKPVPGVFSPQNIMETFKPESPTFLYDVPIGAGEGAVGAGKSILDSLALAKTQLGPDPIAGFYDPFNLQGRPPPPPLPTQLAGLMNLGLAGAETAFLPYTAGFGAGLGGLAAAGPSGKVLAEGADAILGAAPRASRWLYDKAYGWQEKHPPIYYPEWAHRGQPLPETLQRANEFLLGLISFMGMGAGAKALTAKARGPAVTPDMRVKADAQAEARSQMAAEREQIRQLIAGERAKVGWEPPPTAEAVERPQPAPPAPEQPPADYAEAYRRAVEASAGPRPPAEAGLGSLMIEEPPKVEPPIQTAPSIPQGGTAVGEAPPPSRPALPPVVPPPPSPAIEAPSEPRPTPAAPPAEAAPTDLDAQYGKAVPIQEYERVQNLKPADAMKEITTKAGVSRADVVKASRSWESFVTGVEGQDPKLVNKFNTIDFIKNWLMGDAKAREMLPEKLAAPLSAPGGVPEKGGLKGAPESPSKPLPPPEGKAFAIVPFDPKDLDEFLRTNLERLKPNKEGKYPGEMLVNTLINKSHPDEKPLLEQLRGELRGKQVTLDEVKKVMEEKMPRVEVKALAGESDTPERRELSQLRHNLETASGVGRRIAGAISNQMYPEDARNWIKDSVTKEQWNSLTQLEQKELTRLSELRAWELEHAPTGHEASYTARGIATPKSPDQMPGAVDLLVRIPTSGWTRQAPSSSVSLGPGVVETSQYQEPHYGQEGKNVVVHSRGYMETLPDGRKVFHLIEVQSQWAQDIQRRLERAKIQPIRGQEVEEINAIKAKSNPLLPHAQRLGIKAAIEYAKKQGADAIALSDASTTILSESVDTTFRRAGTYDNAVELAADLSKSTGDKWQVFQSGDSWFVSDKKAGFDLHYDKILPDILEKMTGYKGEMVNFGEHQNALEKAASGFNRAGDDYLMTPTGRYRPDLILRNPDGSLKTDVTARLYPLDKVKTPFSMMGSDKAIKAEAPRTIVEPPGPTPAFSGAPFDVLKPGEPAPAEPKKAANFISRIPAFLSEMNLARQRAYGFTLPRITKLDRQSGEALARFAAADNAAPHIAKWMMSQSLVPGADPNEVGALLSVERLIDIRRRAISTGDNAKADAVNFDAVFQNPESPIKSMTDVEIALRKPEVMETIRLLEEFFGPERDALYKKAKGVDPEVEEPHKGSLTGSFINLKFVTPPKGKAEYSGKQVDTRLRKTPFAREATGAAEMYDVNLRRIIENTYSKQLANASYRDAIARLEEAGLAKRQKGKFDRDITVGGEPTVGFDLGSRTFVSKGGSFTQGDYLYVRKDIVPEFKRLVTPPIQFQSKIAAGTIKYLNWLSLTGYAEAAAHSRNIFSAIQRLPDFKNIMAATGGPQALLDTLTRIYSVKPDSADSLFRAQRIARINAMRPHLGGRGPEQIKPARWTTRFIEDLDFRARIVADQVFDKLVEAKRVEDTETNRREFINRLGNYNIKTQGNFIRLMRSVGLNPFATAAQTFTAQAFRSVSLDPQLKAMDDASALKLRAALLSRWAGTIGTVALINAMLNKDKEGNPDPFPDETPILSVKLGESGKYFPMGDILGYTRDLRSTGLRGLIEGERRGLSSGEIAAGMSRDIFNTGIGLVAGPPVRFASAAVLGQPPMLGISPAYTAEVAPPGAGLLESQPAKNLLYAAEQASPIGRSAMAVYKEGVSPEGVLTAAGEQLPGAMPRGYTEFKIKRLRAAERRKFAEDVWAKAKGMYPKDRKARWNYINKELEQLEGPDKFRARKKIQSLEVGYSR